MQWSLFLLILMGHCSIYACQLHEYHFIEERKTWHEAQEYCRENYTDLATVPNMTDMERLRVAKGSGDAWIGLYNQTNVNRTWHWSLPGLEFDEHKAKWSFGEPNDNGGPENCGFINSNQTWGDVSCEETSYFICYNETNTSNKFHKIDEKMKWLDAQSHCRQNHKDLVSGLDQLQDEELITTVRSLTSWAIVGLFRDKWSWSDGSNFFFRNWDSSFNNLPSNEGCAMTMLNENGRWKNDNCNSAKPFFCYDNKLILIKENKTWVEALNYCRQNYYDLVHITNDHQQRWTQERAKKADSSHVWLGLRYTCTLEFWFWVSDEVVSYENWASGGKMNDCDMSAAMETGG